MRLEMALPHNIPTLEACGTGNWTCPDNVWRCVDTPSLFISCDIDPSLRPMKTNHLPIILTIDLTYLPSNRPTRFNYRIIDWKEYKKKLEEKLTQAQMTLPTPINTPYKLE
jgi:hypothetical protein